MENNGLTVEKIFISGRNKVTHDEILTALGIRLHTPMVFFSLQDAHDRLKTLPWVHSLTVERQWPDTLFIHLEERKPLALWQHEKQIYLVDKEGAVIKEKDLENFMHLPSITGPHAAQHLPELLHALSDFPEIKKAVVSATWVGNRRWNIHLENKVTLMLPEHNLINALERFRKYEQTHKLIEEARKSIDLRIPQRIILA
jgi:cell division protein FtsQ